MHKHFFSCIAQTIFTAALATTLVGTAAAQSDYPNRPVSVIVPQATGGANDTIARIVAAKLSEVLGQQFVVENRPGAGGNIGTAAAAKAKPDSISFASASTSQLVSSEMLAHSAGISMTHVPYKSGPAAMTDLIGGQVNMFTADFAVMLPQVKAGKVRGLAVTSAKRSRAIPELPTVNEALGIKDYELIAYFAAFAPAGTPPEIVAKLNKALNDAANAKEIDRKSVV